MRSITHTNFGTLLLSHLLIICCLFDAFALCSLINLPHECQSDILKVRLMRMIKYNEPTGFEIILHSECRKYINSSSPEHLEIFSHLLNISVKSRRNVAPFLKSILKGKSYSPEMQKIWASSSKNIPFKVLLILREFVKAPDSNLIYSVASTYPIHSAERLLLQNWLLTIQGPTIIWPFRNRSTRHKSNNLKTKKTTVYKSSEYRSFVNFKALKSSRNTNTKSKSKFIFSDLNLSSIDTSSPSNTHVSSLKSSPKVSDQSPKSPIRAAAASTTIQVQPPPSINLHFGHIYGWSDSHEKISFSNKKAVFKTMNHEVVMRDAFLGFSDINFNISKFAEKFHGQKSFFNKKNSALRQRILSRTEQDFGACRTLPKKGEIEVILQGQIIAIVLESSDNDYDNYSISYPTDPYSDLTNGPTHFRSVTIPVKANDILLLMPRSIFNTNNDLIENPIYPHDISGSFNFTDVENFAGSFANFVNFIHLRTKYTHTGLIAVGGYIYDDFDGVKQNMK